MRQMHGYAVLLIVLDCTTLTNYRFSGPPLNVQNPQPTTSLLVCILFHSIQLAQACLLSTQRHIDSIFRCTPEQQVLNDVQIADGPASPHCLKAYSEKSCES